MSFKVGDQVRIKKASEFFKTQGYYGVGRIKSKNSSRYKYQVRFDNGELLGYNDKDLEPTQDINDKINKGGK